MSVSNGFCEPRRDFAIAAAVHVPVVLEGTSKLKSWIGPSILNADLSDLSHECQKLMSNGADYLHLDVMDGHFVPDITFGPGTVKCLRKQVPKAFFDMHMMVADPDKYIKPMWDAGATQYTFHVEASKNPLDTIRKVKEFGLLCGIAIKPGTPVDDILKYLDQVDMALVMTVEPGKGGQAFMEDMLPKVESLRAKKKFLNIEVDGGVNPDNVRLCADAGANMIVSGTAVVTASDQKLTMDAMREIVVRATDAARVHY